MSEPAQLRTAVETAVDHGWQVATHAIGDAAVGSVIDAYLEVHRSHPGRDLRDGDPGGQAADNGRHRAGESG